MNIDGSVVVLFLFICDIICLDFNPW